MESSPLQSGDVAVDATQKPGFWHPAMRPDNDDQLPQESSEKVQRTGETVQSSQRLPYLLKEGFERKTALNSEDVDYRQIGDISTDTHRDLENLGFTELQQSTSNSRGNALDFEAADLNATSPNFVSEQNLKPPAEAERPSDGTVESIFSTENETGQQGFLANKMGSGDSTADPFAGMTRQGTDLSSLLANVTRTSTFPDDSQASVALQNTRPLPASQARSIVQATGTEDDAFKNGMFEVQSSEPFWESDGIGNNQESTSFFDGIAPTEAESSAEPDNEEARYEEGIPLMAPEANTPESKLDTHGQASDLNNVFHASTEEEDEGFFSQGILIPQDSSAARGEAPPFDRKSTAQVLDHLRPDLSNGSEQSFDPEVSDINAANGNGIFDISRANAEPVSNDNDLSGQWKAALDDDEFLVEDADDLLSESDSQSQASYLDEVQATDRHSALDNMPQQGPAEKPASNLYTPHQPSISDLGQDIPEAAWGSFGPTASPNRVSSSQAYGQSARPQFVERAESFADQAKGGYKSPYDLPMDLTKPRKRVQMSAPVPSQHTTKPPPPRSSSIVSNNSSMSAGPSSLSPTQTNFPGMQRPASSASSFGVATPGNQQTSTVKSKSSSSSFFEELPVSARPRPTNVQGRYAPQVSPSASAGLPLSAPGHSALQRPPTTPSLASTPASSSDPYGQFHLQKPERLDPFPSRSANPPTQPPTAPRYSPAPTTVSAPPKPASNQRYSPAPNSTSHSIPPKNRYVSQPTGTSMPPPSSLPFQPRTSSPLAHHERLPQQSQPALSPSADQTSLPSLPYHLPPANHRPSPVTASHTVAEPIPEHKELNALENMSFSPFAPAFPQNSISGVSPQEIPPQAPPLSASHKFSPPKRSHTSSPGRRENRTAATTTFDLQRPASAHDQASPSRTTQAFADLPSRPAVRQRGVSQSLNFMLPTDGLESDHLQRWRGSPIFRFGFGGNALTCFPKHIPRYVAGQTVPMIKPHAGEVKVQPTRSVLPFMDQLSKFPGPLRSKSKKKELLSWLLDRITAFEHQNLQGVNNHAQLPEPQKRHEEKIVLWKLVKTLVEFDGVFEGKPDAVMAATTILYPEFQPGQGAGTASSQSLNHLSGICQPAGSTPQSRSVNVSAMETIRQSLLRGEREKAVWIAVDGGLWAHAMLLASTLDRAVWKQVAQEFVRQEVKTAGQNTESLAALYDVLAGNLDESVDELVPPSARAGLQMVSKVSSSGPVRNALDGLDRWRETLALILNNRSQDDYQALAALGRLLASYGRIEAAHCCSLFSRSPLWPSMFGAGDDPQTSIVLLGADHHQPGVDISLDEDAILLTESFEFATSVLATASNTSTLMPHLQAFKLHHAMVLAENGFKTEAQQYCDVIASTMKSSTKASPYHHPHFVAQLDDLTRRLQQAPVEGSSSWISKPSMEKVSGSMWSKFSNFVAGDDSDAASTGSGKETNGEFGPFAKMAGTPTISRAPSVSDLYSGYPAPPIVPATGAASRYAPTSQYTPLSQVPNRSSFDLQGARTSLDSQRSPSLSHNFEKSPSYDPGSVGQQHVPNVQRTSSPHQPVLSASRYQSTPPQSSYAPSSQMDTQHASPYKPETYVPTPPLDQLQSEDRHFPAQPLLSKESDTTFPADQGTPSFGGYDPTPPSHLPPSREEDSQRSAEDSYFPQQSSYGYEPSSTYSPYVPEPDSPNSPAHLKPSSRSASPPKVTQDAQMEARKRRDQEAEENFRRIAEQEADRDKKKVEGPGEKTVRPRASWFGSFMSFGKSSTDLTQDNSGGGKVIRAKLGEESSFYYDPEIKKWVNRKDPNSATASTRATPPPPRAPSATTNRSVSSPPTSGLASATYATPPPPLPSLPVAGPPSRTASPAVNASTPVSGTPPTGSASPAPGSAGLAAPPSAPSRPMSAMSSANNIDDLLGGPPAARKAGAGGTARAKKKGRGYVDVMAK